MVVLAGLVCLVNGKSSLAVLVLVGLVGFVGLVCLAWFVMVVLVNLLVCCVGWFSCCGFVWYGWFF